MQIYSKLFLHVIFFILSLQITTLQLEREKALEHKNRLSRMLEDRDLFEARLKALRRTVYEVRRDDTEIAYFCEVTKPTCNSVILPENCRLESRK